MSVDLSEILEQDVIDEVREEQRVLYGDEVPDSVDSPSLKHKVKFSSELDLTLLLETTTVNPFTNPEKWDDVSNKLTQEYRAISKDDSFTVSSRACKDRVNTLLKKLLNKTETSEKSLKRYISYPKQLLIYIIPIYKSCYTQ